MKQKQTVVYIWHVYNSCWNLIRAEILKLIVTNFKSIDNRLKLAKVNQLSQLIQETPSI